MMQPLTPDLPGAMARRLQEEGWFKTGDRVVVALSGGVDSLSLLHILRFGLERAGSDVPSPEIHPVHFDHRMREDSRADAEWLGRLTAEWGLPLHLRTATTLPRNEAEARTARYAALREVRRELGARWILTGHHADDQRETVLFRILRGTGLRGLGGMEMARGDVLRPLLGHDRIELERYAQKAGLTPLQDPTNTDRSRSRNLIRHEALPLLERVHPGASDALLRLARRARESEAARRDLLAPHLERLTRTEAEPGPQGSPQGGITVARDAFLTYSGPVQSELLRALVERTGSRLSEAGTRAALEFMRLGSSGGRVDLPGSVVISRDFSIFRIERRSGEPGAEAGSAGAGGRPALEIDVATALGPLRFQAGARSFRVRSAPGEDAAVDDVRRMRHWTAFRQADLHSPLAIRTRRPGDRAGVPGRRKKLKKLLGELRIPRATRDDLPLLLDGRGLVVWIPGYWRGPLAEPRDNRDSWIIGVEDVGRKS
jgi:tRNA(Ile)-lysidine synthase